MNIGTHCLKLTQNVAIEFLAVSTNYYLIESFCLVTLFVRKVSGFQKLAKMTIFSIVYS